MPDFDEEWKTHKKFAVITLRKFDFGLPSLENDIQDKIEKFIEELKKIQGTATDISPLVKRHLAEIISTITLAGEIHFIYLISEWKLVNHCLWPLLLNCC